MRTLSLLDLGFFIAETQASPKHVGGLLLCKPPPHADAAFAKHLYEDFLGHTEVKAPFNQVIHFSLSALPQWRDAKLVDLQQHVFYHRLTAGKNDRQALYQFVADLHTPVLSRTRPLWAAHIIDGLEDGRFAVYYKMHHAYADGVTMTRWTAESMSKKASETQFTPIWSRAHAGLRASSRKREQDFVQMALQQLVRTGRHVLGLGRLTTMLMLESAKLTKNAIALPFVASSKTLLTGQVTPGRQFATAAVSMERVERVRKRTRSTLNHVALTCLDGALRRYFNDQGVELPGPIIIQMPVNLRREDEKDSGNKIGIIQVELSPPTDDPYVRLRNIGFSLRGVRTLVDSVAPEAIASYTILSGLVGQIAEVLKLSDTLPPVSNTLVSNVPGPKESLYIKGALMEEMHPISTLPPSNLLNITLFSYAGTLFFGLIASDELRDLPDLAAHVDAAFAELEAAVL